jgi:hypothetical protein
VEGSVLELLIREHQAAVYRYVCYLGAQLARAEDYVQETFLRAYPWTVSRSKRPGLVRAGPRSAWNHPRGTKSNGETRHEVHAVTDQPGEASRAGKHGTKSK